jgi:WD40 repeat protein
MVTACLVGAACAQSSPTPSFNDVLAPTRTLAVPTGDVTGLTWLPDGHLVVTSLPAEAGPQGRLEWTTIDGSPMEVLPIPIDPACRLTSQIRPATTGSGTLAFVDECYGQDITQFSATVETWDSTSGTSSSIGPVPQGVGTVASRTATYVDAGDGICARLLSVGPTGTTAPAVSVSNGTSRFRLDDPAAAGDCTPTGNAKSPTLDPSDRLAFFASPAAVGVSGDARLDAPWGIYTVAGSSTAATLLLDDVGHARDLAWSPDGKRLAFGGEIKRAGDGVWLFTPGTGSLERVSKVAAGFLAWSPDGRELGAMYQTEPHGSGMSIDVITVGPD